MHENETSLRKCSDGIEHRRGNIGDAYISDFQPVFRGNLVFRERSSGVPQEI